MTHESEAADVVIEPIVRLEGRTLADFTRIYEAVFPGERETTERLLGHIASARMRCLGAMQGEELVGLAVMLPLRGAARGIQYLVYLGVDPARQGRGIGGRLLRGCAESGPWLGIVFEVEDPDEPGAGNAEQRRRRVDFYRSHGAVPVMGAPEYRAPNFAGPGGPLAFELMWLPMVVAELEGGRLRSCVEAILVQGYGLTAEDEVLHANLAGLELARL